MQTSTIMKLFFLIAGIYLFSFGIYYQSSNFRQTEENFRMTTVDLISDDPMDSRQNFLQRQIVIPNEMNQNQNMLDGEAGLENEDVTAIPSEEEEERDYITEQGLNDKIISDLTRELYKTRAALTEMEEAANNMTQQVEKAKDNLNKTQTRFQAKDKTLSYVSNILTKINPFRKLGIYETMPAKYYNHKPDATFLSNKQFYAIKHNPGYCDAVDLYNYKNPANLFKKMNFIADYAKDETLVRDEVMRKIGNDVMPGVSMEEKEHQRPKYDLAVNGTMYFFKRVFTHRYYQMNKEWACLSQMYNHIPGSGVLTRKDLLVETINNYIQEYANRSQCLQDEKFFPTAYRLDFKQECDKFFTIIKSPKFHQNKENDPIQYLIKTGYGAHRASGIFLMDAEYENEIRETYQDGELCGILKNPLVAQKYISNPLLLDKNNKFDFRIYMLVASVDPLIVYYHDGFLRVSLSEYDKFSKEKNVHFTNTHLSKEIFQKAQEENTFDGMTEEQLRDYQMWTMEELENYLLKTGKIQDENWLNNYLRPKFKEAFVHIARMAEKSFYKSPSLFEMYGLDFVIDENLDIWLIEVNASPQLIGTSEKKSNFLIKMLTDLFELEYSYLRSRMSRVHRFVHGMEKRLETGEQLDYEKVRKAFKRANFNKLEPQFQVNANNSFVKILDKNLKGPDAYFGHLDEQCMN